MNATDLARDFVALARSESQRVGHRNGGTQGAGAVPFDTGALQKTFRVTKGGTQFAQVAVGNDAINYAEFLEFAETLSNGQPNLHKGFLENLIINHFPAYLEQKYGVTVTLEIIRNDEE